MRTTPAFLLAIFLAATMLAGTARPSVAMIDPEVGARRAGGSNHLDARVISARIFRDSGNTTGLGNDALLPDCLSGGDDTAEDAWYRVTLGKTGRISAWTTCASAGPPSYDTRIAIFDENLNLLTCNDDDPGCSLPNRQSRISDYGVGAGTYYIVVDGWGGTTGPYELNVEWSENGPACSGSSSSNPTAIGALPFSETGDNGGDCDDFLVSCDPDDNEGGPDHWYQVDVDVDVYMDVATSCDAAGFDTRLAILDSNLDVLFCNDDDPACASGQSTITDALLAPGSYFIVVDSADLTGGSYTVQVDTTHAPPGAIAELLPDIITIEEELYDHDFVTDIIPGRTHIRFSNATANIGAGKLYLWGVLPANPDGSQDVRQRIFRETGDYNDRDAGSFVYHAEHDHIHVEDWAAYRIRAVTAGNGVGPVLIEGPKTSFCIFDSMIFDSSLPGHPSEGEFPGCDGTIQGQSVGWADRYGKVLPGQNIDITDLPDGEYWLESEADPTDAVLEADETNNLSRVRITIGNGSAITADTYEPNDSQAALDSRGIGTTNSPVLGPCGPLTNVTLLSIHQADNEDYFRFYLPAEGTIGDAVWIDFVNQDGNLDLELLDLDGTVIGSSATDAGQESISLDGVAPGWYDVRIYGRGGDVQPSYMLSIDPSENGTPTVAVTAPPAGDVLVAHGYETYNTTWEANDPESNETWVNVYVNSVPELDGNEILLPDSRNTPADQGSFVINTAYLAEGTYYVYVEITDGGTIGGSWSEGTLTLFDATSAPESQKATASQLLPNVPNPFNPSTVLRVQLQHEGVATWRIYDARGVLVRTIASEWMTAGNHERIWNGRDDAGNVVSSGVYYTVFQSPEFQGQQKILLLK
jgi:hypothetical protein